MPVVAVASSDGVFPSTVATAFTVSPSFGSLPFGTSAVQFPSWSAVVSTFVPSGNSTSTFAPGSAVPVIFLSPAFGCVIFGAVVFSSSALPVVAVASSDGVFPSTVATAFTVSPSFGSLPSGTSAVQFPSWSAVVSTFVPSGSSTTTFAFGSALPLISLSPAFGAVIVGFVVCSAGVAAVVVAVASSDGVFPSTVATAFTVSPSFGSFPSGTSAVQFPSWSAVVSTFVPSGSSTTTFAFGSALPLISLSPAFGCVIVGAGVWPCFTTVKEGSNLAVCFPLVILTSPLLSTEIWLSNRSGFAALTASLTLFCSSAVNESGFATSTTAGFLA